MVNEISPKSSNHNGLAAARHSGERLPGYAVAGIVILVVAGALLAAGVSVIRMWFTPIMWTGYILFMDGLIRRRRGTSLLSDYPLEFGLLCIISIASWAIFEGYNVMLKNWHYVGLPDNMIVRTICYAWAFATISPGMFLTYEYLDCRLPGSSPKTPSRLPNAVFYGFVIFGAACMVIPFVWSSTWMSPLVWMSFAFLIDPLNGRRGERSFLTEFFTGHYRSMSLMFLAGALCGILWEFWNYWAITKWHYDVPYFGHIKIFEMPVLGFLGFMPFAVESYAIYIVIRKLIPIRRQVKYLG